MVGVSLRASLPGEGGANLEGPERGNLPPRSSALTGARSRSESRNRGMQKSTPPLRGVFLFSVVQTEGANSTALQRADIHALPTAAAPPSTSSNSASIIVHARWSAARL